MQYTTEVEINLPRERVIELFDNPGNLSKWQAGLVRFEHLSGEPGQTGAKSRLLYKMGGREIEMIETVVKRDIPDEFSGTYETKGVWNEVVNFFQEAGPGKTRWVVRNEFKFKGFMKIMALFMPRAFKKQSLKTMQDFKAFAEGEATA